MRKFPSSSAERRLSAACLLAAALLAAGSSASAAPDAQADAVTRFLADRGLIGESAQTTEATPENAFVRQVRDRASEMVLTAMNFLGVPYRRGGSSVDDGFDCSGFTRRVFEISLGLVLPRRADEQARAPGLSTVGRDELRPGDLVFFNTLKRTFSHVGIYIGEGKFIHAPRSGSEVRVEDMRQNYWTRRYTGARRAESIAAVIAPSGALPSQPPAATASELAPYPSR